MNKSTTPRTIALVTYDANGKSMPPFRGLRKEDVLSKAMAPELNGVPACEGGWDYVLAHFDTIADEQSRSRAIMKQMQLAAERAGGHSSALSLHCVGYEVVLVGAAARKPSTSAAGGTNDSAVGKQLRSRGDVSSTVDNGSGRSNGSREIGSSVAAHDSSRGRGETPRGHSDTAHSGSGTAHRRAVYFINVSLGNESVTVRRRMRSIYAFDEKLRSQTELHALADGDAGSADPSAGGDASDRRVSLASLASASSGAGAQPGDHQGKLRGTTGGRDQW